MMPHRIPIRTSPKYKFRQCAVFLAASRGLMLGGCMQTFKASRLGRHLEALWNPSSPE